MANREALEKLRRHLGEPTKVVIEGDEFELSPLHWTKVGLIFEIAEGYEPGKPVEFFTPKTIEKIKHIVFVTVQNAMGVSDSELTPEIRSDIERFCARNLMRLMEIVLKLNGLEEGTDSVRSKIGGIRDTKSKMEAMEREWASKNGAVGQAQDQAEQKPE